MIFSKNIRRFLNLSAEKALQFFSYLNKYVDKDTCSSLAKVIICYSCYMSYYHWVRLEESQNDCCISDDYLNDIVLEMDKK